MIVVIGAGPAGLAAAKEAGAELVLEEHEEIGRPVTCAGLISKSGIDKLGVYDRRYVLNRIRGAHFHSAKEGFTVKAKEVKAYSVDRTEFDQRLAKGLEVKTGCRVERIREDGRVEYREEGQRKIVKADAVILACGPNIGLLRQIGAEYPKEGMLKCAQYEFERGREEDMVELHFGKETAPNFFAWKIPAGDRVRIGLGVRAKEPAVLYLRRFIEKERIKGEIKEKGGGIVPIKGPLERTVYGKVLLCGDAAGQVKPTTGGGVVTGIIAGRVAGRVAREAAEKGIGLEEYQERVEKELGKELMLGKMMREMSDAMPDARLDMLFKRIRETGLEKEIEKQGDMDKPSTLLKMDGRKIAGVLDVFK